VDGGLGPATIDAAAEAGLALSTKRYKVKTHSTDDGQYGFNH
jgi:hypothetical protein